jgi:hypothetical protein
LRSFFTRPRISRTRTKVAMNSAIGLPSPLREVSEIATKLSPKVALAATTSPIAPRI